MEEPLKKRLIVSAVFVAMTFFTNFAAPFWFFFSVVQVLSAIGLNEFLGLVQKKNIPVNRPMGLVLGALLVFFIPSGQESVILALACLVLFVMHFDTRTQDQALIATALTVFGLIYVNLFFGYLLKIKVLPHGAAWVFFSILLAKGGDAGAYFTGKRFGRTKLIEHVSPNKSVEGAIGGFLTALALAILSKLYLPHVPLIHLALLGCLIAVFSQFGDLAESLIKRNAGVKDSGEVPGLGGILDVLDSLLLTVSFIYYYILVARI